MAFRLLVLLCLLSVFLHAQSAASDIRIPAKVDAAKYTATQKSIRRASRSKKKAKTDAIWKTIRPPRDILSSLSGILRTVMGRFYKPQQILKFVQRISKKVYFRKKLTLLEKKVWASARRTIISELYTSNCNLFFAKEAAQWGGCCRILASKKYFGLCVLLRGLTISPTMVRKLAERPVQADHYETGEAVSMNNDLVPFSTSRWYETYEESVADEVVYVDLLSISCYPVDYGLCSQYCCDANNMDGVFCNSDLECY